MDLINTYFDMMINWKQAREAAVENNELLCNISPSFVSTGFDLQRSLRCTLDRIRTSHDRCTDSLHKWGMKNSPECECGAEK